MSKPTATIEGHEYPIGQATVGHAEVIAPVADLFMAPDGIGAREVTHNAGQLIDAVAVITGCPRDVVARQPLHEFLRIVEETAAGWIKANSDYVQDQVVPEFEALMQRASEVMKAAAAADAKGATTRAA